MTFFVRCRLVDILPRYRGNCWRTAVFIADEFQIISHQQEWSWLHDAVLVRQKSVWWWAAAGLLRKSLMIGAGNLALPPVHSALLAAAPNVEVPDALLAVCVLMTHRLASS